MVFGGSAFSNCVSSPVSVAAANSSKPPAPSLYPGSTEMLLDFFFSRHRLAAQSKARSDSVELTDTHTETQTLLQQALHDGTRDARVGLTVLTYQGKGFPTQFDWVAMTSIGESTFSFTPRPLE